MPPISVLDAGTDTYLARPLRSHAPRLVFHREFGRQRMAFAATNMRLGNAAMHLLAICRDLYPSLEQRADGPTHGAA